MTLVAAHANIALGMGRAWPGAGVIKRAELSGPSGNDIGDKDAGALPGFRMPCD